jgi:hypothetical protein
MVKHVFSKIPESLIYQHVIKSITTDPRFKALFLITCSPMLVLLLSWIQMVYVQLTIADECNVAQATGLA